MQFYQAQTYTSNDIDNLELEQIKFPYNDSEMIYNGRTHEYEITEKAFLNRGIDIRAEVSRNGIEDLNGFLKRVSKKFYLYAYKHCYRNSPLVLKKLVAKLGIRNFGNMYEYREQIKEVMVMLGEYLAVNGDVSQISGFDIDTGNSTDIGQLRYEERDYPAEMKTLMHQLGLNFGGVYRIMPNGVGKDW